MSVIAVEGVVDHGLVRLQAEVTLPEGTRVYVVVPDAAVTTVVRLRSPRLAHPEQAGDFEMDVTEG
jgi:hypothetical protein